VVVDRETNMERAHDIAHDVEHRLKHALPRLVRANVHPHPEDETHHRHSV